MANFKTAILDKLENIDLLKWGLVQLVKLWNICASLILTKKKLKLSIRTTGVRARVKKHLCLFPR